MGLVTNVQGGDNKQPRSCNATTQISNLRNLGGITSNGPAWGTEGTIAASTMGDASLTTTHFSANSTAPNFNFRFGIDFVLWLVHKFLRAHQTTEAAQPFLFLEFGLRKIVARVWWVCCNLSMVLPIATNTSRFFGHLPVGR